MNERFLYLSVNPFESRVALRENGRLVVYRPERTRATSVVGNLYEGRVRRVLPGMEAAFVDIGVGRDGFLYVREAGAVTEDLDELFLDTQDRLPASRHDDAAIGDLLREGQEILVQVLKDGIGSKGPRLTSRITLPGRFLVYLPTIDQRGVSRRITDDAERERLRSIAEDFPGPGGWIVRTAGEGRSREELEADRDRLLAAWERIHAAAGRARAPALVYAEPSPVLRTVRDLFTDAVQLCWVDDVEAYEEILEYLKRSDPRLVPRVKLFRRSEDLMTAFGIDRELEKTLRPRIWLRSGGYLIVNQTEALVAIDVNTGKFVGRSSLEDTAYRINLEAVREIVRQLRLRDLGGIIVIDFIDMDLPEHRAAVYEALRGELGNDPARSQLLPMSDIGLVQLTRKRTRPSLDRALTRVCPTCHGSGRVKSLPALCLDIRRAVLRTAEEEQSDRIYLAVHPEVCRYLQGPFADLLEDLEKSHALRVEIRENPALSVDEYEVVA